MIHQFKKSIVFTAEKSTSKNIKLCFISFLFLICQISLHSQVNTLQFRGNLTSSEGLSINIVTKILQDSRGFLWFGTYNGVNRYDGYNVKVFTPQPSDEESLSGFTIHSMIEDSEGYIWIGTSGGLNRYDWKTEKFKRYFHDPNDPNSISHNNILSLYQDESGILWVGTSNGLNKYDRDKDNFAATVKVSSELNQNALNSVTSIEEDNDGNLWLGTWKGLTCFHKSGKVEYLDLPLSDINNNLRYNLVSDLLVDDENNLWIGASNGLGIFRYSIEKGKFKRFHNIPNEPGSLSNNVINVIYMDRSTNIWIGTENGLNRYDAETESFVRIFRDPSQSLSLMSNFIYSILEDKTGLFWISTERGISLANIPLSEFVTKQIPEFGALDGSRGGRINTLMIDKFQNIWIGSRRGLFMINEGSKNISLPDNQLRSILPVTGNNIRSFAQDADGVIWIGTSGSGLVNYNPLTQESEHFIYNDDDNESISNNGILTLLIDANNDVWAGTWWGLNKFNRSTGKFKRTTDFTNNLIWVLFEDSYGNIWAGTDGGGVNKINPGNGSVSNYLERKRIFSIFESKDGLIWLGTSEGLASLDLSTDELNIYTIADGLPSNIINSINEDQKGNLWISTDKVIVKYDHEMRSFKIYGERNGLYDTEFSANATALDSRGRIYFGGLNGLVSFHPGTIQDFVLDANVVFTDLKIFNQSVKIDPTGESILAESVTLTNELKIPSSHDVITIEYALLDYFDVSKNKFKYKLDGFDKDWNEVGQRHSATYTNLPPGEYELIVKAYNDTGFKNEKETSIKLTIVPSFFQTAWFTISLASIIVIIVVITIQLRINAIRKSNKVLENRVIERTKDLDKTIKELNLEIATKNKFFSIIAHDLRSPFTALMGFSRHLVDELDSLTREELSLISESILKSTTLTFGLLENLLHWARIQTGKIEFKPEKIMINEVLGNIVELYKGNAENKGIEINLFSKPGIVYADSNMIETVIRNLISNSIKFTNEGGKITIQVDDKNDFMEICIEDTGVGIAEDKINKIFEVGQNVSTLGTRNEKGSGLGLILCKEFIEYNNGSIKIESVVGQYSKISFTLPKLKKLQKPSYSTIDD